MSTNTIIRTMVETIGPHTAEAYLKTMEKNRKISERLVDEYAEEMKNGNWMLNGETIVFDEKGHLVNGQHRLSAVVKSGAFVQFVVVRGVIEESLLTFDSGKKRTTADTFNIDGVKNYMQISSIVRKKMTLERDSTSIIVDSSKRVKISKKEQLEEYWKNSDVYDSVVNLAYNMTHKVKLFTLADTGAFMAYLMLERRHDRNDVEHFFRMLFQYKTTSDMDCLKYLRDKIVSGAMNGMKVDPKVKQDMLAQAWNRYINDKDSKRLAVSETVCEFV